jgi:hypothetical protein
MRLPFPPASPREPAPQQALRRRAGVGDEARGAVAPLAQQGVAECQQMCDSMHPDNAAEQLECYKRYCW